MNFSEVKKPFLDKMEHLLLKAKKLASNCSVIYFYQPNIHHWGMSGNKHLPLQITKPITFAIDFMRLSG